MDSKDNKNKKLNVKKEFSFRNFEILIIDNNNKKNDQSTNELFFEHYKFGKIITDNVTNNMGRIN